MKKKAPSVSRVSFVVAPSARPARLVSHLVHHRGVPRLSLRPIRRDLNLRLLNRRAQSRRLLCARDRIHASHVSRRARRSIDPRNPSLARLHPHAPSLAAPTMACASFSAIMSFEIPSARVASMTTDRRSLARARPRRRLGAPTPRSVVSPVSRSARDTNRDTGRMHRDGVETPSNSVEESGR